MSHDNSNGGASTLICQRLEIVDEDGYAKIEIRGSRSEGGPRIAMYDADGLEPVVIAMNTDEMAVINLRRTNDQCACAIGADNADAGMKLFSSTGEQLIALEVGRDHVPFLNGVTIDE